MAAPKKDPIFGYIDLTDDMRKWLRHKIINERKTEYASGWKVIPAHHRENPNHGIIMRGYADVEESNLYHFDDPERRDDNNEIVRLPLPLHTRRDKEYFREENARMRPIYGFDRYKILESRKKYVEEFVPERGFGKVTSDLHGDAIEMPAERPARVVHPDGGYSSDVFSKEVIDKAIELVKKGETPESKSQKTAKKKSRTETRLVSA